MVTRGEVHWYDAPDVTRRPFLVLTRPEACEILNQLLAAPITRTIRGIPTEVLLTRADGMPSECVVSVDNITTITPAFCTRHIATLDATRMREVCEAIGHAIDC